MKLINTFGAVDYELAQHNYEIVEDNYDTQVIKLKGQYPFGIQMFCNNVYHQDTLWKIENRFSNDIHDIFTIRRLEL